MQLPINGETMHYVREGEGPAIVFLHFLGGFSYQWRHQIAALKDRYTCIAFDHRGFRFSTFNGRWDVPTAAQAVQRVNGPHRSSPRHERQSLTSCRARTPAAHAPARRSAGVRCFSNRAGAGVLCARRPEVHARSRVIATSSLAECRLLVSDSPWHAWRDVWGPDATLCAGCGHWPA
jgi:hypothetical protein